MAREAVDVISSGWRAHDAMNEDTCLQILMVRYEEELTVGARKDA